MNRPHEELIGGLSLDGRLFRVDVILGASRYEIHVKAHDGTVFAREVDIDQMIEILQKAKKRAAERNESMLASMRRPRDDP